MKRLSFIFLFIVLVSTLSFAQGNLRIGEKQFNAGLGFSDYGVPIYAGLDFGVYENITIGPKLPLGVMLTQGQTIITNNLWQCFPLMATITLIRC